MCNPVKIFECKISNYITEPDINVIKYIKHNSVRTIYDIEKMPLKLLKQEEKNRINVSEDKELTHEDILELELRWLIIYYFCQSTLLIFPYHNNTYLIFYIH